MKIRLCDSCNKEILNKIPFYRISKQTWENRKLIQLHTADICEDCYNKLIGDKQ